MAIVCVAEYGNKGKFKSKISGQNGHLGGTPGPRPKNGTFPAKMGRMATLDINFRIV